jgi:hypothetical protein
VAPARSATARASDHPVPRRDHYQLGSGTQAGLLIALRRSSCAHRSDTGGGIVGW